jgi:hypothetical protein
MPLEFNAKSASEIAKEGFVRMQQCCKARAMFLKDYVGHYYYKEQGMTGDYPVNLIFLAIAARVPNLVMKEGINKITTPIMAQKDFAELLGLALDKSQKQRKLKKILRAALVDMHIGFAIAKTSIAAGGLLIPDEDDINVDPGQIYTELISLDDFTCDPGTSYFDFSKSIFLGHNIRTPRQKLLDLEGWNEELVMRLPSADNIGSQHTRAEKLTQKTHKTKLARIQDDVNVVELWFPEADVIAYIPNPYQASFSDFLKMQDYYGPAEGPYTFCSLTPPVPDNPLPIAPVSVWRDLNEIANKVFKKFMDQADRQKDILLYSPEFADVAQAVIDAADGESIATSNPEGTKVVSFGGQNPDNERMIGELRMWFNYMAENPDQMAGVASSATTGKATEVQVLQQNASITTEDMRDTIAEFQADISRKEAWFMIEDPFINMPLTKRTTGGREVQVSLTPEDKYGDWFELYFTIVKRSMTVKDPAMRTRAIMEFYTNIVPSVMSAAIQALQMGVEFNVSRALMQAAEEMGISDMIEEIFNDPDFQRRIELYMTLGPKAAGKADKMTNPQAIQQQGGFPGQRPIAGPQTIFNQQAQETAAIGQSAFRGM